MEEVIVDETSNMIEELRDRVKTSRDGKLRVTKAFATTANAIIWRVVSGRQIDRNDPTVLELTEATKQIFLFFSPDSLLKLLQFNTKWAISFCKWMGIKDNLVDVADRLNSRLAKEAEEGVPDEHGSFIERFHHEMKKQTQNTDSIFNEATGLDNLKGSLWDLFLGGTDTSSTFLEWAIVFMVTYPDTQVKLFEEINSTIGDRRATLNDKTSLPYVECFLDEVLRCSQITDLGVPHQTVEDTTFKGFLFPKGTQVFADVSAVHNDKAYWGDPEVFRPDRFLDDDGKFRADDHICSFGIGKRRCMGEVLGKANIFYFLVTLVQNFEMEAVAGMKPSLEPHHSIINYPKDFEAIFMPRN